MNTPEHTKHSSSFSRVLALILGLFLPLIIVFSGILTIQAGIHMGSLNDLKTKIISSLQHFMMIFIQKLLIFCVVSLHRKF